MTNLQRAIRPNPKGPKLVPHHPFLGFPRYLDRAAVAIAHPEASIPARRITPLAAIANLCAQASTADEAHLAGIHAKAAEFRHQLHAAALAADMMLEDVFSLESDSEPITQRDKRRAKSNPAAV
jgi:hypothetical protein